jgi:hypothetical protein
MTLYDMSNLKLFLAAAFFSSIISISCASTPMPRFSPVDIPADYFGLVHAGRTASDEEYALLNEMGVSWILETFYWGGIERERGVFDFSWYDDYVNAAVERGVKVLAVLAYDTPWTRGRNRFIHRDDIPHFLNFLEVIVTRYKGKVDAWQIWNEPNWVFWRGSNREFFELSRLAALKIRETDPNAYIIGGGFWRAPSGFIRGMHRAGAFENLDALSFHPYATNPRNSMRIYDNFINLVTALNFTGDIWVTEVGYPTGGWYPTSVSMNNLPSFVVKTITGAAARGSRALFWYELSDTYNYGEAPNRTDSEIFFGLTYPDHSRKNGSWAYELCARFLPGSRYISELPQRENIPSSVVSFYFKNETTGINTLIIWNDRNSTRRVRISVSSPFTLHDISNGTNVSLSDNSILEITRVPVFITWQSNENLQTEDSPSVRITGISR